MFSYLSICIYTRLSMFCLFPFNLSFSASQQQSLRLPSTNVSAGGVSALTPLPPELRELLRQRLGALETQLLRKVAELEEEKSQLYNETAAHRQRTESALNSLLDRITELEKSKQHNGCSELFGTFSGHTSFVGQI